MGGSVDGTGQYDMFYPNSLKDSPSLQGATNHPYNVEHNTKLDHITLANQTPAFARHPPKNPPS
jgi:hypothetical protein